MAEWLEQASQWHEMYCHDLEVMSSNPGQVELGVRSTSALTRTWTKHKATAFNASIKRLNLRCNFVLNSKQSDKKVWKNNNYNRLLSDHIVLSIELSHFGFSNSNVSIKRHELYTKCKTLNWHVIIPANNFMQFTQ